MNLTFWIALAFWAFIIGFWLGLSYPISKQRQKKPQTAEVNNGFDFYISDREYSNFLNYDGTTQEKE